MKTDVLIVGGGPGGAAAAMFLIREGIKPVILEQEEFPRFHIGESLTGEAAQVVRRLCLNDEMIKKRHPIKHGVKVFGANAVNSWVYPGLVPRQGVESLTLDHVAGSSQRVRLDDAQGG